MWYHSLFALKLLSIRLEIELHGSAKGKIWFSLELIYLHHIPRWWRQTRQVSPEFKKIIWLSWYLVMWAIKAYSLLSTLFLKWQRDLCLWILERPVVCNFFLRISSRSLSYRIVIIIVLLATTPRSEMHSASYVFGSAGFLNQTGGWNNGLAFLFGLLSVQWTVSNFFSEISTSWFRSIFSFDPLDDCMSSHC